MNQKIIIQIKYFVKTKNSLKNENNIHCTRGDPLSMSILFFFLTTNLFKFWFMKYLSIFNKYDFSKYLNCL